MSNQRGFTLIEVTIAMVVSGVVALLAYGSLQAGLDAGGRIQMHRQDVESLALLRSIVVDALRHPASASAPVASSFSLSRGEGGGLNDDRLQFVSRGVSPPHGAGALWNVVLEPTPDGLRFSASPLEATPELPIVSVVAAVRGMRVRVMAPASNFEWIGSWEAGSRVPHAIELRFFDRDNREIGAPTVVVTAMETGNEGG